MSCPHQLICRSNLLVWLVVSLLSRSSLAAPLQTTGVTTTGTNTYPNPHKPTTASLIKTSHPLSAGLVSALPLNEGGGTNFYDAVTHQTYAARSLTGTPGGGLPPAWFTPAVSPDYPWGGPAISNNSATAQAIQSTAQELDFINNVTVGYSYATLVQPLDTTTFGRIMDGTGPAVITLYLNVNQSGFQSQVATTWRNSSGTAIVPHAPFTVNQWILVLCTVKQGLGVMYVNGVPMTNSTSVDLARSWTNQAGQVVYNATGNGSIMPNANFSSWWIWNNRVLTAQEAAQMYANPWAMFHSEAQKGVLKGTKVTLSSSAVVSNLCFYSHEAAGNLRLAIYDNQSPKNLLWQSGALTNIATSSWITTPITNGAPTNLTLAPGTYWLTWQVDTAMDVPSYTAGASGDGFSVNYDFGAFPDTLSGEQSSAETWSMYFTWGPLPEVPVFSRFGFQPEDIFQLQVAGSSNTPYSLQASTNLTDWLRLDTAYTSSNGLQIYSDTNTTGFPKRFYRAVWP